MDGGAGGEGCAPAGSLVGQQRCLVAASGAPTARRSCVPVHSRSPGEPLPPGAGSCTLRPSTAFRDPLTLLPRVRHVRRIAHRPPLRAGRARPRRDGRCLPGPGPAARQAGGGRGAHSSGRERLLRAARAAAQLNHAKIVSVFDAGQPAGMACIVMGLLRGARHTPPGGLLYSTRAAALRWSAADLLCGMHCPGLRRATRWGSADPARRASGGPRPAPPAARRYRPSWA